MEVQLAGSFLLLLLPAWLPAGAARQPEESDVTVKARVKIWLENLMVQVNSCRPVGLEVKSQANATAQEESCTNLTCPIMGTYGCRVFITRGNLTGTGNGSEGTFPRLDYLLCVTFGLAAGTFLYMPVIGLLLYQHGRNRKGKFTRRQVAKEDQLSMAAPGTGTEDLTYANLKFEKKGTNPAASDVLYTEIKPAQQKQSGGDAGVVNAGVDVSPK